MNQVILIGRLARDPELRYSGELAIAHFTIAVDRQSKGKEREADFLDCSAFEKQAENLQRYKKKGDQIAIEGRIQKRAYEKDGEKRYTTEIIANRIEYLGSQEKPEQVTEAFTATEEDIPF